MNQAVSKLQDVNMAGQDFGQIKWNLEAEFFKIEEEDFLREGKVWINQFIRARKL